MDVIIKFCVAQKHKTLFLHLLSCTYLYCSKGPYIYTKLLKDLWRSHNHLSYSNSWFVNIHVFLFNFVCIFLLVSLLTVPTSYTLICEQSNVKKVSSFSTDTKRFCKLWRHLHPKDLISALFFIHLILS